MSAVAALAHYEVLAALTRRMHESAQRAEWDALIALERERRALIDTLKPLDAATPLAADMQQRKNALIASVLSQDVEIRKLVQAWLDEFDQSMQSNLQKRRLLREYGA